MGYTRCAAPGCTSKCGQGLAFKQFPADQALAAKWLKEFPINFKISSSTFLCQKHFDKDQFEKPRCDGKIKFKSVAVPRLRGRQPFRDITNVPGPCAETLSAAEALLSLANLPISSEAQCGTSDYEAELQPAIPSLSHEELVLDHSPDKFRISKQSTKSPQIHDDEVGLMMLQPTSSNEIQILTPYSPAQEGAQEEVVDKVDYKKLLDLFTEQSKVIDKLEENNKQKDAVIEELRKSVSSPPFRKKYRALLKQKQRLHERVKRNLFSPWLTENQTKAIARLSNRGVKWGIAETREGLILKMKCGTGGYDAFVRKYPILPSVRTLQESVQFIKFTDNGILEDMFDLLESMSKNMSDIEKDCDVILDEMEIQQGTAYDLSLGKWVGNSTLPGHEGLAKKALVFLLAGIARRWKVSVAVFLTNHKSKEAKAQENRTGEEYKKILDCVIQKAENIGLRPCAIVTDMGADNLAFWKSYQVTGGRKDIVKSSFSSPTYQGSQIFILPDSVHLFKAIKSAMENNGTIVLPPDIVEEEKLPSAVVDYSHIDDLYEFESGNELKVAFRLKPWNAHCGKHFKKMNMGTTRAVVCHRTGVGLQLLAREKGNPSYLTTSWFFMLLNTFIELVTCRHRGLAISHRNQSAFDKAISLIKKVDRVFENLKIGKEGHWKPCQRGMRVLCASLLGLIDYFLNSRGYQYLMLGRFTSDCIENLFSLVRFRQPVPSVKAFLQCLKVITLAQLSESIKGSSYDYEDSSPLSTYDFLEEARRRAKERATDKFYDSIDELVANPVKKITSSDFSLLNDWEKCVVYDMAGSVLAALKSSNSTLCISCIDSTKWKDSSPHPCSAVTDLKEFTYFRTSDSGSQPLQFYVSDEVFRAVLSAEITFRLYRAKTMKLEKINVLNYFVENLMYVWNNTSVLNCHGLGRKILQYFIHGRLKEFGRITREEVKNANAMKRTLDQMGSKSIAMREAANKITGNNLSIKK